jgi:hypothetical protein
VFGLRSYPLRGAPHRAKITKTMNTEGVAAELQHHALLMGAFEKMSIDVHGAPQRSVDCEGK